MLSQIAQEVTCLSLHINNAKIVMSFDIHALEGQGDALSQKKNWMSACMPKSSSPRLTTKGSPKNIHKRKSWSSNPNARGWHFLENLGRINRRFGSSELNLACHELPLGMRIEGPSRFPRQSFISHIKLRWNSLINVPSKSVL
jgi:hypothetical protein